jgi:hypothetical protein
MRKATALVFLVPILVTVGVGLAFYRPTSCSAVCKSGKDQLTAIHLPKNWSVSEKLGFGAAIATDPRLDAEAADVGSGVLVKISMTDDHAAR